MPKSTVPVVVYAHNALENIVSHATQHFPNEAGGFLFGDRRHVGGMFWHVRGFYAVTSRSPSRDYFSFTSEDYFKATKAAVEAGMLVVGFFHSHPWTKKPVCMTHHSPEDAAIQIGFDFPLSMVIGLNKDKWVTTTWRNHLNAPIFQRIGKGSTAFTIPKWLRDHKNHKIWGQHLILHENAASAD